MLKGPEPVDKSSKVSGHKINTQELMVCLLISHKQSKHKIKGKKLHGQQKENEKIKYLGMDLTREIQNQYAESDETLLKEIKGVVSK